MRERSEKSPLNLPFSPEGRRPGSPRPSGERDRVRGKDQVRDLTEQRDRARRLRREQTDAERTLWRALRSRQFSGLKFRRQHPVGPYIADFCCLQLKLAIELDGGQHALRTDADERRSHRLAQAGYRVLRFWNHEVLMNLEGVLHRIAESIEPSPQPSPRGRGGTRMFSPKGRGRQAPSSHISHSESPVEHASSHISHSTFRMPHSNTPGGCS